MLSQTPNIAIAILAAGASRRMGSPKQLLKWGNASLIQHTINTAKSTFVKEVIVVLGANKEAIASEIDKNLITVIINSEWELGLGKSIACVAKHLLNSKETFDGLLIVLADQPFVTPSFLDQMIRQFNPDSKQMLVTSYNGKKRGVPALFDKVYFQEIAELSGDDGAKSILKNYKEFVRSIKPSFNNLDIDTKEDYHHITKSHTSD